MMCAVSTDSLAQDTEIFCPKSVAASLANPAQSCKAWRFAKHDRQPP